MEMFLILCSVVVCFLLNSNKRYSCIDEISLYKNEILIKEITDLHSQFKNYSHLIKKQDYINCQELLNQQKLTLDEINYKTSLLVINN